MKRADNRINWQKKVVYIIMLEVELINHVQAP